MQSEYHGYTARMRFSATPYEVRAALNALFEAQNVRRLNEGLRDTAQIVLAEVLNNVVEHAYAQYEGDVDLMVNLSRGKFSCQIRDQGAPMPAGIIPNSSLPTLGNEDDLPEGGFGWGLISTLAENLEYLREGPTNQLTFSIVHS